MVHGKLRQHTAQRVAEGSRLWLANQSTIPEASTLEVGQLSELGARVAAMVLGALLPIRVKAGDTTRLCHSAGGGAPWQVLMASGGALRRKRIIHRRGGSDRKV